MTNIHTTLNKDCLLPGYWFIFKQKEIGLLIDNKTFTLPTSQDINKILQFLTFSHVLGEEHNVKIFCAEIAAGIKLDDKLRFFPLKEAFNHLDTQWHSWFAKSIHIIAWDKQHRYCGACGKKTLKKPAQFEAFCGACTLTFYPRISPSIIVLIKRDKQILMARGPHFAPGVYGLIAGFVSPGECLEEAVQREVMEEVGIKIKNIIYFGSQPWPFPDSLMMAFEADYDESGGDITIDQVEIEAAGWYSLDNLPGMPASSLSIASLLIAYFSQKMHSSDGLLE